MSKQELRPGDVRTFDFQSDVHRGRYRLIEEVRRGPRGPVWICEHMEPTDEEIESVLTDPYFSERDPAWCEREALDRIDRTGERFETTFVSDEQWAAMF